MKLLLEKVNNALGYVGVNLKIPIRNLKGLPFYCADLKELKKQKGTDTLFPFGKTYAILHERFEEGGTMRGHYFHQDLHVAQRIAAANPQKHVDIGSRTDGFVAHVASFRPIEILDIRPIDTQVKNIHFTQANLMELPQHMLQYCDSISSLHAIEHFGLGRYNDPIDYWGYQKALHNIAEIIKPGGVFYFGTPIGPQRIEFNAHRVFAIQHLLDVLSPYFTLQHFSFIDDAGNFHPHIHLTPELIANNCHCHYGCGVFELIRK